MGKVIWKGFISLSFPPAYHWNIQLQMQLREAVSPEGWAELPLPSTTEPFGGTHRGAPTLPWAAEHQQLKPGVKGALLLFVVVKLSQLN